MASKQEDQAENLPPGASDQALLQRLLPNPLYAYDSVEHANEWLIPEWSRVRFTFYLACEA